MKIGIIGGGAAGMVAAISAARIGADVYLLEGTDRLGHKILATGNGKCNFTNDVMDINCFRSNSISDVAHFLQKFGTQEALDFFDSIHMLYQSKNGYYYPLSGQASTVLDALRFAINRLTNIQVLVSQKVSKITYHVDGSVQVVTQNTKYTFDKVILACGSKAAPKTGSDGSGYELIYQLDKSIKQEPVVPALVQLRCKETYLKAVAGVRCDAQIMLYVDGKIVASERGELQLTDYGVSGIPVFQISRFASYACKNNQKVEVCINIMPQQTKEELKEFIEKRRKQLSAERMEQFCNGLIHKKVAQLFCKLSGISSEAYVSNVSDAQFETFVKLLQNWKLRVDKPNGFDMAQICAGGVSMSEIDMNFALKKYPSIYVVGELLDVDGICGGYNLHWAWASGYLAGKHASKD